MESTLLSEPQSTTEEKLQILKIVKIFILRIYDVFFKKISHGIYLGDPNEIAEESERSDVERMEIPENLENFEGIASVERNEGFEVRERFESSSATEDRTEEESSKIHRKSKSLDFKKKKLAIRILF